MVAIKTIGWGKKHVGTIRRVGAVLRELFAEQHYATLGTQGAECVSLREQCSYSEYATGNRSQT